MFFSLSKNQFSFFFQDQNSEIRIILGFYYRNMLVLFKVRETKTRSILVVCHENESQEPNYVLIVILVTIFHYALHFCRANSFSVAWNLFLPESSKGLIYLAVFYSYVPNKRGGNNKRRGWKKLQKSISGETLISSMEYLIYTNTKHKNVSLIFALRNSYMWQLCLICSFYLVFDVRKVLSMPDQSRSVGYCFQWETQFLTNLDETWSKCTNG